MVLLVLPGKSGGLWVYGVFVLGQIGVEGLRDCRV